MSASAAPGSFVSFQRLRPNLHTGCDQVWQQPLLRPLVALLYFLHELGTDQFGSPCHAAIGLGAKVETLHQIIRATRARVLEMAVESGSTDEFMKFLNCRLPTV
jgi:hypothetical protein